MLFTALASAQDAPPEPIDDPAPLIAAPPTSWEINLQPYIWIPASIEAKSTVAGSAADIDLSFSDVLDDFDQIFALSGRTEAWRGQWGIIFDGMYISIKGEFDVQPFGGGPIREDIDVDVAQSMVDLALGWRPVDRPVGDDGMRLRLDVFGGTRYQYLKQEIDLSIGPKLGTSKDWMELLIGARATLQLNEHLALGVRADASGFGIGSASELTWNLYAGADITFSPKFDLKVGYRLLDIDYDTGSGADEFGLDARMHGPYIGASFRF